MRGDSQSIADSTIIKEAVVLSVLYSLYSSQHKIYEACWPPQNNSLKGNCENQTPHPK